MQPRLSRSVVSVGLLAGTVLGALVLVPDLAPLLALVNGAFFLLVACVQIAAAVSSRQADPSRVLDDPRKRESREPDGALPFVTVHVPICNEPPELVMRSLNALAELDWPHFEVICLDNNTQDRGLWNPVREHCKALGPRFRFFHVDKLPGAKAGALNLALKLSDARATFVAVVDSDYRVTTDFLRKAWGYLSDADVAQVQFPQAYRNGAQGQEGLTGDYAHYFHVFMSAAESSGSSLLTGTLSVIRRDALMSVGGWSDRTVTEDADLGSRLAVAGLRGHYASEIAGRGLMPTELGSLRSQRRRWVHGNADTLFGLGIRAWMQLGFRRGLGVLAQLTAWFNFLAVPCAVLAAAGVLAVFGLDADEHRKAAQVAALTVLAQLAVRASLLALAPRFFGEPRCVLRSLAAHFGLAWEGASAWLESLVGTQLRFARTNKFLAPSSIRHAVPGMVCAAVLLLTGASLAITGQLFAAAGSLVAAVAFASVLALQRQLVLIARRARPMPPRIAAGSGLEGLLSTNQFSNEKS